MPHRVNFHIENKPPSGADSIVKDIPEGGFSGYIKYARNNHMLLSLLSECYAPKEKRTRPFWVTCYLFIVSVTVTWFIWANFAQIGLLSEITVTLVVMSSLDLQ